MTEVASETESNVARREADDAARHEADSDAARREAEDVARRASEAVTVSANVDELPERSPSATANVLITDRVFIDRVHLIREMNDFVQRNSIAMTADDRSALKSANIFGLLIPQQFPSGSSSENGRRATPEEWAETDLWLSILSKYYTIENRKRADFRDYGKRRLAKLPITALVRAIVSLVVGTFVVTIGQLLKVAGIGGDSSPIYVNVLCMLTYCGWSFFLGRAGAAAFVALNLLSITKDASFDISDQTLVETRLTTGSLFAFVISVPVGLPSYREFIVQTISAGPTPFQTSMLLLLPFVLGFSTTLVLALLQQFVSALGAFFNLSHQSTPVIDAGGRSLPAKPPDASTDDAAVMVGRSPAGLPRAHGAPER